VARGIVEAVAEGETQEAEDAWRARSAVLERAGAFDPDRLPVSTRPGPEGMFDGSPDEPDYLAGEIRRTFEFGLQRVLDGVAVLVDARAAD
jgi:hypothetical protein